MKKDIIPMSFDFNGNTVSTIIHEGGEPWWIAKEVCEILGLKNVSMALVEIDQADKMVISGNDVGSNISKLRVVNESGLYDLIFKSIKPEAKKFRRWVTSEVLPQIRKTGSYNTTDPMELLNDPAILRSTLLTYSEKLIEMQPKADGFDRISSADGSVNGTEAAKALQIRPKDLFSWLSQNRWIYKRPGAKQWLGYQDKVQQGLLTHKVLTVLRPDGSEKICERVLITPKGLTKLSTLIGSEDQAGVNSL